MTKLLTLCAPLLGILASGAVHAAPSAAASADYYRLRPLQVREVVPTAQEIYSDRLGSGSVSAPAATAEGIDWNLVNLIGDKIIQLIKAGKPVVNVKRDVVAVLPPGVTAWGQLSGWQLPATKVYEVTATNYLGINVIDLRLKVSAMYGGGVAGRGKYLANVGVVPTALSVLWGFSCDVWTEHQDPVNMGSAEAPVAGLGLDIRFRYGSALQEENGAQDYVVTGAGQIEQIQ